VIRLTPAGVAAHARREQHAAGVAEFMLALIHPVERKRMISAMREIERILRRVRWDDIRAHAD
jgi:hypothetical protein